MSDLWTSPYSNAVYNQISPLNAVRPPPLAYASRGRRLTPELEAATVAAAPAAVSPFGEIPVSAGNTGNEQWPMYNSESARNIALNLGMDRRTEFTTPTKMLESVTGHLAGVAPDNLLDDPELKNLLAMDPGKAHFVYHKLSGGRDLSKDRAEMDTLRRSDLLAQRQLQRKSLNEPMEFVKSMAQDLIKRGAHYDPNTGDLSTWQYVEPDGSMPGQDARPVRKRVKATPEEMYAWQHGYPLVMGMPAPSQRPVDPALAAAKEAALNQPTDMSEKITAEIKRWEGMGATMTPARINQIIAKVKEENKPLFNLQDSRYLDFGNAFTGALLGKKGYNAFQSPDENAKLPSNMWGRMLESTGSAGIVPIN